MPISPAVADATLLVVDDLPENIAVLRELLAGAGYRVRAAASGRLALQYALQAPVPDLILLDVMMPEMDGFAVLAQLQADARTQDIPVIFVTALSEAHAEERGLQEGAVDYLTKPIRPAVTLARVRAQLEAKRAREWLRDQNAYLEAEVQRRMSENALIQAVSIRALAHLAATRDHETGIHILRTQAYVRLLAQRLRHHPRFAGTLDDRYIERLVISAPLHDIGKVGIPDHILQKSGALSASEWGLMKTHARLGSEAIELAERDIRRPAEYLSIAKEITRWHHEWWDGSGYPDGIAGEAIPVSARLMAVADVFDALISTRLYKSQMEYAVAREAIVAGRGSHFDPDVIDAFVADFDGFVAIAREHEELAEAGPARARSDLGEG